MTAFNPETARQIAAEAREDEKSAVPAPWLGTDGCAVFADGMNFIADTFTSGGESPIEAPWTQPQCVRNAAAIARMRNRNASAAEQLEAALASIAGARHLVFRAVRMKVNAEIEAVRLRIRQAELVAENERLKAAYLRGPMTLEQVEDALAQGRIERKCAEGDHAWLSLVKANDSLKAENRTLRNAAVTLDEQRDAVISEVERTRLTGIDECIAIVKRRRDYFGLYRDGDMMKTKSVTFAIIDELLVFLEAHRERVLHPSTKPPGEP